MIKLCVFGRVGIIELLTQSIKYVPIRYYTQLDCCLTEKDVFVALICKR